MILALTVVDRQTADPAELTALSQRQSSLMDIGGDTAMIGQDTNLLMKSDDVDMDYHRAVSMADIVGVDQIDATVAYLMSKIGIHRGQKILAVGPGKQAVHIIYGALKGAQVDVNQEAVYKPIKGVKGSPHLRMLRTDLKKILAHSSLGEEITKRINIDKYPEIIQQANIPDNTYRMVVAINVLDSHLIKDDSSEVIKHVLRVLEDGGVFIFTTLSRPPAGYIPRIIEAARAFNGNVEQLANVQNEVFALQIHKPRSFKKVTSQNIKTNSDGAMNAKAKQLRAVFGSIVTKDTALGKAIESFGFKVTENESRATIGLKIKSREHETYVVDTAIDLDRGSILYLSISYPQKKNTFSGPSKQLFAAVLYSLNEVYKKNKVNTMQDLQFLKIIKASDGKANLFFSDIVESWKKEVVPGTRINGLKRMILQTKLYHNMEFDLRLFDWGKIEKEVKEKGINDSAQLSKNSNLADRAMTVDAPLSLNAHPVEVKDFDDILTDLKVVEVKILKDKVYVINDGLPEIGQLRKLLDLNFEVGVFLVDDVNNGRRWLLHIGNTREQRHPAFAEYKKQGRQLIDFHTHPNYLKEGYLTGDVSFPSRGDLDANLFNSNFSVILSDKGFTFVQKPRTNPLNGKPLRDFSIDDFSALFDQWTKTFRESYKFQKFSDALKKRYQEFLKSCGVEYQVIPWEANEDIKRMLIKEVDEDRDPLIKTGSFIDSFQAEYFRENRYMYSLGDSFDNIESVEREIELAYEYGPRSDNKKAPTREEFLQALPWPQMNEVQGSVLIDTYNKSHPEKALIFDRAMTAQEARFQSKAVNFAYQQLGPHYQKEEIEAMWLRTLIWSQEELDPQFLLRKCKVLQNAYEFYKKSRKGMKIPFDDFGYFDEIDSMRALRNLPPIIVKIDKQGNYTVIDGNRRVLAAVLREDKKINAYVAREPQASGLAAKGHIERKSDRAMIGISASEKERNSQHSLLIVEDMFSQRENLQRYFESMGFQVEVAINGKTALDKIRSNKDKYAFIITDFDMPVMDGLDLVLLSEKKIFSL